MKTYQKKKYDPHKTMYRVIEQAVNKLASPGDLLAMVSEEEVREAL